jgi:hypothetical protein
VSYFNDLVFRLRRSWVWVALQFGLTLALILVGLAWTRIPEKHWWQVVFTLLVPALLVISLLELEAGTMRSFADDDGKRVKLVWGAATLLVWAVLYLALWTLLDWCDDRIPLWAGYLNSRASAGGRATLFTYAHLQLWFTQLEWVMRWVIIPAKIIPYAMCSAQWGWRLPLRRIIRLLFSWRWWLAAIAAALLGVSLPAHFFNGIPQGSVAHQVWAVIFKVGGAYLLAVFSWVVLLAWAAVLMARQPEPAAGGLDQELFERLRKGQKWIWALAVCAILSSAISPLINSLPDNQPWQLRLEMGLGVALRVALWIVLLILMVSFLRCIIDENENRVRFVIGVLSPLIPLAFAVGLLIAIDLLKNQPVIWLADNVLVPFAAFPIAAASANWGLRLPWKRIFSVVTNWQWWVATILFGVLASALPALVEQLAVSNSSSPSKLNTALLSCVWNLIIMGCWVMILTWVVVLLVKLPLPESGDDVGGNS